MIDLIILYFVFGAGLYTGLTLNNPMSFVDASLASLLRGLLLGFIVWPVGIIVQVVLILTDRKAIDE